MSAHRNAPRAPWRLWQVLTVFSLSITAWALFSYFIAPTLVDGAMWVVAVLLVVGGLV